ncbi:MAG: HD domain-containing protein [Clostridia bacterium]|nr:HD domain-containing protein [Clostridia bacterium]
MERELFDRIESYMLECVKESAHDKEHIYRVLNYCLYLADNESGIDYDVLITAALLHDIGRDGKKKDHAVIGSEMANDYLSSIGFPRERIEAVCHAIKFHSNKSYGKQQTVEAKILYDADKLDAVGVMGIARSLIGIGNYNNPMYEIVDNIINTDESADNDTFIRYYMSHIAKNYDRFYTEKAKALAERMKVIDYQYMQEFIKTVNDNQSYSNLLNGILN